jgi:integrase
VCVCFGLRISEALALKWGDVDWLKGKLRVERGIVRQRVDDVKTETSHTAITITSTMIEALKVWKQTTQFSAQEDWIFASPAQLGRLSWSADSVNDAYKKAASAAGIAHVSTHSMRHTYRSWLDAVGTPIAVQQKLMRHADIRTTMNTYGEVVTDEMARAASKVAGLALNGSQADCKESSVLCFGGSVCESNTPATSKMPPAGFEDRDDHRTACASTVVEKFFGP